MALKKSTSQKYSEIEEKILKQDENIKEQQNLTKFFIIIVALTLVGTLVGIAGLYINSIDKNSETKYSESELNYLRDQLTESNKGLKEYQIGLEVLKAKNPYLK